MGKSILDDEKRLNYYGLLTTNKIRARNLSVKHKSALYNYFINTEQLGVLNCKKSTTRNHAI